ncbi:T9SS type A sorting domain-containing protein [Winogradskyella litorisediminis]|uniref:T9SS type A sorting domain-containing protein n=1 Tax=Winogradskyella litorisediminis TaxID=1156618 RepID=A0ABW3N669_9FLAO
MKKIYFLIFLASSLFCFAQVTPTVITSDLVADLTGYTGATEFPGQAEYFVYLSTDNTLDKPIFLIDGFDPGDTRNIDALYTSLDYTGNPNFTNLGDELRAEGFDIVVVNFPTYMNAGNTVDGGADFIERNALTLVALIEDINALKAMNSPEQNVIIGPSMGGLISRYALNYMENNMLDADTRLWISLDSPHLGANVPIGLQHQFNYLAFNDLNPVADVQPLVNDVLNSPAARQLLVDHFESHLLIGSTVEFNPALTLPIPHPYRTQFEANINSLDGNVTTVDFPQNVRKVSVVNGSGIGTPYHDKLGNDVISGFEIVNTTIPVSVGFFTIDVDIVINMTPASGTSQLVSEFNTTVPFVGNVNSVANSGTLNFDGVDASPGGLFDISGLSGELPMDGLAADFLDDLTIDKFSFIPTVSALALEITDEGNGADNINWFHDIDLTESRATTNNTPFDNTFLPDDNEDHVEITSANAAFVLSEIRQSTLGENDFDFNEIKLVKNPVSDILILQANTNENATVQIIDYSGKLVFTILADLNGITEIPINLNSGFYILNVKGENGARFTTKFIVNK